MNEHKPQPRFRKIELLCGAGLLLVSAGMLLAAPDNPRLTLLPAVNAVAGFALLLHAIVDRS